MRDLPAARMGHRPALDGLRALAVLAVVAVHYAGEHRWLVRGGGLGVNAFFVLSGFLITRLMLEELAGHRRPQRTPAPCCKSSSGPSLDATPITFGAWAVDQS